MSYTLTPYLVRIDDLRRSVGSGDQTLLQSLSKGRGSKRRRELEDLLAGSPLDEKRGSEYGYALEVLCGRVGRRIDVPEFEGVRSFPFDEAAPWMLESGPPIDLPRYSDFPYVGHLRLDGIREAIAGWTNELDDDSDPEINEALEALRELYQTAEESGMDVVTFYY